MAIFNMKVCRDLLALGASLEWPLKHFDPGFVFQPWRLLLCETILWCLLHTSLHACKDLKLGLSVLSICF